MIVDTKSLQIIATAHGRGREHDFKLFKRSHCPCHAGLELLGDGGYQGVKKLIENSRTPHKRWRGRVLTVEQRLENKCLAGERVVVENVIRRLKVFSGVEGNVSSSTQAVWVAVESDRGVVQRGLTGQIMTFAGGLLSA